MTFNQAYKYAMEHSNVFRWHDIRVKEAQNNGTHTPCLLFSVEPYDEAFYYGFDGVDLCKGKHPKKAAVNLINSRSVLFI